MAQTQQDIRTKAWELACSTGEQLTEGLAADSTQPGATAKKMSWPWLDQARRSNNSTSPGSSWRPPRISTPTVAKHLISGRLRRRGVSRTTTWPSILDSRMALSPPGAGPEISATCTSCTRTNSQAHSLARPRRSSRKRQREALDGAGRGTRLRGRSLTR